MATDEADARAPDRDESSGSSSDSDDDNESGSGQNSSVEWLATGRAKRSTAGNRMKAMLANEEPAAEDSDLELLFAEDEDDAGFTDEGKDDASDVQMDSSSDEEDAAPGKDDEMEGEKELQRKEREKKAADRKRKAQEAIPAKFRKKVRIDQPPAASGPSRGEAAAAAAAAPQPRPKKKSERLSWLPSVADAPTRASERATTRSSKEHLHQQMIEREKKRKKQLEMMEKKAKRLEALKKPPMTQQDRLAEAAIVEKRNSKSLNRWEEAEKQREEERAAKLAAMYNRKLEGPVVTFWSGILELSEGEMKHVGRMVTMEEKAPRKKRQSAAATLAAQEAAAAKSADQPEKPSGVADGTAEPKEPKTETQGNMEKTPSAQDQPATASTTATEGPAASLASQPHPPPSASESVKGNETQPGLAAPDVYLTEAVFMPIGPPLSDPKPSEPPPSLETSQPLPDAAPPPTQTPTPPPPPLPTASIQHTPEVNQPLSSGLAAPTSLLAPPAATAPSLPPPRPAGTTLPFNVLAAPSTIHGPSPLSQPPLTPSGALSVPMMAPPPPPPPLPPTSPIPPPAAVQQLETKVPDIPVSENKAPETKAPEIKMSETPAPESAMPATEALETRASESAVPESKAPEAGVLGIATPESKAPESRAVESTTTTPQSPAAPLKEPETPKLPETPSDTRITRSCIMLQNFDEEAIQDRQVQTQILFGRRMGKVGRMQKPGHAPHCVITNRVARYRDPLTGLPFYNAQAYKEIQKLHRGEYKWSSLVGAWVGAGTLAARGVPQGFLGGPREKVPEVPKPKADPERKDEKAKESSSAEVEPKVEPKVEPLQAQSAVSSQSQQQQQPQQAPQPQLQQPLPAAPAAAP